ncbi:MAG TPA: DUF1080 domain-containing protein [Planctomycetota bacterium]|nr:DUF1080 domain-containing protein [Planctomycetota bacterium]
MRLSALSVLFLSFALAAEEGFVPMFNGKDLSGWVNANCAPETWSVKDGVICCTGKPIGALRTERQYENFILEAEWRHLSSGGNSGIFIWGTPISAPGQPFLRGIEVQVLDHGFNAKGKNEWYTTHGDVFPIHGATMKPLGKSNGKRSFPSEERSKPSPEWNHYRIECNNGSIRLHVNGKQVSGGDECNYRKGYLALESEGAPVEFRNVRIKELPTTNTPAELTAPLDEGFRPLYTGVDLRNWRDADKAAARWQVSDWTLSQKKAEGDARHDLVSEAEYGDAEFIVDLKPKAALTDKPFGVKVRSSAAVPLAADALPANKWTRIKVRVQGAELTCWIGDKQQSAKLDGAPARGALVLIDSGGNIDVANIFVRELK